jgi:PAS domain S-box-containing protein
MSPRAAAILGFPAESCVSSADLRRLMQPGEDERSRQAVEHAIASRGDFDIEYRIIVEGQPRWISSRGRGLYDEDGAVIGMLGVVQDISSTKRIEALLREQTETLETVNRIGSLLAAELDLEKLVQALTDAATELTGAQFGSFFYNVLDARGESYMLYTLSGVPRAAFEKFPMPRNTAIFGPTFRGEGIVRLANVRLDPRFGRNPPYHGMPDGHLPVVSYLAVPVISRTGEVHGGLFFGHEREGVFTERHEHLVAGLAGQAAIAMDNARLYEQAQRARAHAEQANRSKDEFLAILSHELRTPINAIVGWTQMLQQHGGASLEQGLTVIERNARLQAQMIEDLLDMNRIVSGKLRLDLQPVDVAHAMATAVTSTGPLAAARDITIDERPLCAPLTALADGQRLQQVLWNLLSNAIKFTPSGGRVTISAADEGEMVSITVADTGEGIEPALLASVFDRFRQLDSSTTRNHSGLGLGLSIVKDLVEMHGGRVSAASEGKGRGAAFTVSLRKAPASGG